MTANKHQVKRFLDTMGYTGKDRDNAERFLQMFLSFTCVTVLPYNFIVPAGLSWEQENDLWEKEIERIDDELIRFLVADGYAMYHVASIEPLILEHLDYADGYHASAETINGLTPESVQAMLDSEKKLKELFSRNKKDENK